MSAVKKGDWPFLSASTFFGLTPEYKVNLHRQIFELTYYTKGGITFEEAYYMPVYLRNFYYRELVETLTKEGDAIKKARTKATTRKGWRR
jgi:hypothetical protein